MNENENPFYRNHLFCKEDLNRAKIKLNFINRLILFFKKTYVAFDDGWAFFFKRSSDGRIWLIKAERYDKSETW